jgi:hypothetical protein
LPIAHYGKVENPYFWKDAEKIAQLLDEHRLWFFETFKARNILVKKISEERWQPIFIDYKYIGWKAFPSQINLLLGFEKRRKFFRIYNRFRKRFKQC